VLSVEDWAEIRRLHRAEGLSIRMITRVMKVSRNTVRAALALEAPPRYERRPAGSIVDEFEPRIRELLALFPTMPATVIAERVGWRRGKTVFADRGAGASAGVSAAGSGQRCVTALQQPGPQAPDIRAHPARLTSRRSRHSAASIPGAPCSDHGSVNAIAAFEQHR
jgi:hypothetical protein